MSDTSDKFTRSVALEKAINFVGHEADTEEVIKTAEKFRAFLAGETQKPPGVYVTVDSRPVFTLPKLGDGYVYFRYENDEPGANIYYRSSTAYGAESPGGVERFSQPMGNRWEPTRAGNVMNTRRKLMLDDDYHIVRPEEVARNLRQSVTGHRFE